MILELKKGDDVLSKIKLDWIELEQKSGNQLPNLKYEWLLKWWEIFKKIDDNKTGHNKELNFLIGKKNDEVFLIIPLVKLYRKYGPIKFTFLEFLSQQWSAFYCDMLIAGDLNIVEINNIIDFIKRGVRFDVLLFSHLPQQSPFCKKYLVYPYAACPTLDLSIFKNFEDYKAKHYSKNLKNNLVKAYSWAKKNKQNIILTTSSITENIFSDIKKIAYSKIEDGKEYKYKDTDKEHFRKSIGMSDFSDVDMVMINDIMVSYRTNVIVNNTKYGMDASYNREYRKKYQPGALAVEQSIRNCFENSISVLDFGPGIDEYKFKFTQNIRFLNYLLIKGNSWFSFVIFPILKVIILRKSRNFLKKLEDREINY